MDYNNHMNVAYYVLVFDLAFEKLLLSLGLGEAGAKTTGISTMALESHITYDQEGALGQEVDTEFLTRVPGVDIAKDGVVQVDDSSRSTFQRFSPVLASRQ